MTSTSWNERRERERAEAEAAAQVYLSNEGTLSSVALILAGDPEHLDLAIQALMPTLASELVEAACAIVSTGDLHETASPGPLWAVVAEALALVALAGPPSAKRLVAIPQKFLRHSPLWVWELWVEASARRIRNLPEGDRGAWLALLETAPPVDRDDAESKASISVKKVSSAWGVSDSLQLWVEPPVAVHELATWPPLAILHEFDRKRWFDAIDGWSDQRLAQSALFAFIQGELPEQILEFIRSARTCFDEDGELTGSSAGIILCSEALRKAETLIREAEEEQAGESMATDFLAKVASAVAGRPDGKPLAIAFGTRLLEGALFSDNSRIVPSALPNLAWETFRICLSDAAIPIALHRRFLSGRKAGKGFRREAARSTLPALFLAAATIATPRERELPTLLEWLQEALLQSDEWASPHLLNYFFRQITTILALDDRPTEVGQGIFQALERVRRRSEFARTNLEHHSEVPSLLVLLALSSLVEQGRSVDPEADLQYVCERGMRIGLTSVAISDFLFQPAEVVACAACVAVALFGYEDGRTLSLLQTVAQEIKTLGILCSKLPKILAADSLARMLGKVGWTIPSVAEQLEIRSRSTGLPIYGKIFAALNATDGARSKTDSPSQ